MDLRLGDTGLQDLKTAMLRTLFAFAACATASAAPTTATGWQITVDVFEGTLQGFFDSSTFPHLKACASEATDAYDEIKDAIQEIEKLTPADVKTGLKDLGLALKGLKAALADCKASSSDVANFAKAIENGFEHPLSFLFHMGKELLINGKDIYSEVTTAVSDWKAQSYRAAGVQIGAALSKILLPSFDAWKLAHGKTYATADEERAAQRAYEANADLAAATHLQRALGADVHFHLNEYADLAPADFNKRNGYIPAVHAPAPTSLHKLSGRAHNVSVDWRSHGLVADVKNQGSCGSCWAFSTVVSLEGQQAKKTGTMTTLSEQNLVDCVKGEKLPGDDSACCMGCQGGLMNDAFQYMIDHQGGMVDTEAAYPYTGRAGQCQYDAAKEGTKITKWTGIKQGDEDALLDAVATVGPVSIAVDASIGWQLYFGGIMHPTLCSSDPKKMDHGVALVGFGTEKGKDYWIVRNSWGAGWGEHGYARIIRGKNACGLANAASYPTDATTVEEA